MVGCLSRGGSLKTLKSFGKFLLIVYQPFSVKPPNSHSGWTDIDYLASICLALLIANSVESELVYYKCV